ncbi:MAG: hypothetical protein KAT28_02625 [Candidatus Aenigmarchaeota archaeon]|nr:hypothetical protein [Candidatus Aenigmarchaeota archaeon]
MKTEQEIKEEILGFLEDAKFWTEKGYNVHFDNWLKEAEELSKYTDVLLPPEYYKLREQRPNLYVEWCNDAIEEGEKMIVEEIAESVSRGHRPPGSGGSLLLYLAPNKLYNLRKKCPELYKEIDVALIYLKMLEKDAEIEDFDMKKVDKIRINFYQGD